jgi:hypothetical protein
MADIKTMTQTYLSLLESGRKSGKGVNKVSTPFTPRGKYALKEAVSQQGKIVEQEMADAKKKKTSRTGTSIQDAAFDDIMKNQSKIRGGQGVSRDR